MEIKDKILDIEDVKKSKLPLLSLFIRKTAVMTSVPEHLVELIIKDQWNNANKQTKEDNPISEIDFPNIGIFYISKRKSENKLLSLDKIDKNLNDTIVNNPASSDADIKRAKEMILKNDKYRASISLKTNKSKE